MIHLNIKNFLIKAIELFVFYIAILKNQEIFLKMNFQVLIVTFNLGSKFF